MSPTVFYSHGLLCGLFVLVIPSYTIITKIKKRGFKIKYAFILFLLPLPVLAESYVCEIEAQGGLVYNFTSEQFEGADLKTDLRQYVIESNNNKWTLINVGFEEYATPCGLEARLNQGAENIIECQTAHGNFVLYRTELRYFKHYTPYEFILQPRLNQAMTTEAAFLETGVCEKQ